MYGVKSTLSSSVVSKVVSDFYQIISEKFALFSEIFGEFSKISS